MIWMNEADHEYAPVTNQMRTCAMLGGLVIYFTCFFFFFWSKWTVKCKWPIIIWTIDHGQFYCVCVYLIRACFFFLQCNADLNICWNDFLAWLWGILVNSKWGQSSYSYRVRQVNAFEIVYNSVRLNEFSKNNLKTILMNLNLNLATCLESIC